MGLVSKGRPRQLPGVNRLTVNRHGRCCGALHGVNSKILQGRSKRGDLRGNLRGNHGDGGSAAASRTCVPLKSAQQGPFRCQPHWQPALARAYWCGNSPAAPGHLWGLNCKARDEPIWASKRQNRDRLALTQAAVDKILMLSRLRTYERQAARSHQASYQTANGSQHRESVRGADCTCPNGPGHRGRQGGSRVWPIKNA